jgi:hypothetical protein
MVYVVGTGSTCCLLLQQQCGACGCIHIFTRNGAEGCCLCCLDVLIAHS